MWWFRTETKLFQSSGTNRHPGTSTKLGQKFKGCSKNSSSLRTRSKRTTILTSWRRSLKCCNCLKKSLKRPTKRWLIWSRTSWPPASLMKVTKKNNEFCSPNTPRLKWLGLKTRACTVQSCLETIRGKMSSRQARRNSKSYRSRKQSTSQP